MKFTLTKKVILVILLIILSFFIYQTNFRYKYGGIGSRHIKYDKLTRMPVKNENINDIKELKFSKEDLERCYEAYKNPYVLHLRKALNGYIKGTNEGIASPQITLESDKLGVDVYGLDSFNKDYYKSKFIIYQINNHPAGGMSILIIFIDKPDKLFGAWVYKVANGDYDLRQFWQVANFTKEVMLKVCKLYKIFLEDEKHSL
ncbi:MAG: hypothetical protein HYU63_05650 [Armatimonadetes bacterium]|nr:hypothetical protein [Armatimonadota bacterium]